MTNRSFSFVRIHTRLIYVPILLFHTLALEHCVLYALTCSLYPNIAEEKQKNFIYYSLNLTVFEEILTWIQSLGGKEDEK